MLNHRLLNSYYVLNVAFGLLNLGSMSIPQEIIYKPVNVTRYHKNISNQRKFIQTLGKLTSVQRNTEGFTNVSLSIDSMIMQATPIPESPTRDLTDVVKRPGVPEVEVAPEVQEKPETTVAPAPFEELSSVDRLIITKRLRVKRALLFQGKNNRFFVRTPDHNLLYTVEEENNWWVGYLCYGLRPLQLHVTNSDGTEVMRVSRPFACTPRILPCQLQSIQVYAPPENLIGTVEQLYAAIRPQYVVKDAEGNEVLWIHGPRITMSCFKDVQFHFTKPDGSAAGATCKRWEGVMHALFYAPVTDRCGVAFERDLSGDQKALLLAATLIFEYLYYDI